MTALGTRRRARELALQILYQLDVQEQLTVDQALVLYFRHLTTDDSGEAPVGSSEDAAIEEFAARLVRGVRDHLDELDAQIQGASRNWRLERMARVDRNLLRMALWELKFGQDVPARVAINEAIEIAKRYGTSDSSAFVNGILDRCREDLGKR